MVDGKTTLRYFIVVVFMLVVAIPLQAATVRRMGFVMGTVLTLEINAEDLKVAQQAAELCFQEVSDWDQRLSNYKASSEISHINKNAGHEQVQVSSPMLNFLNFSQALSVETSGYFDITVEPLTQLWKLRERKLGEFPSKEQIQKAKNLVNYKNVLVLSEPISVQFKNNGMGFDTGGIGKGYALDQIALRVQSLSISSMTLNFGGEIIYVSKVPLSRSFSVKNPIDPQGEIREFFFNVDLMFMGFASSRPYFSAKVLTLEIKLPSLLASSLLCLSISISSEYSESSNTEFFNNE